MQLGCLTLTRIKESGAAFARTNIQISKLITRATYNLQPISTICITSTTYPWMLLNVRPGPSSESCSKISGLILQAKRYSTILRLSSHKSKLNWQLVNKSQGEGPSPELIHWSSDCLHKRQWSILRQSAQTATHQREQLKASQACMYMTLFMSFLDEGRAIKRWWQSISKD